MHIVRSGSYALILLSVVSLIPCAAAAPYADYMAPEAASSIRGLTAQLDPLLEPLHVAGASVAVVSRDRVLYLKGFGLRDITRKLPVTPSTIMAIGSCTKAFTSMAAMIGVDEANLKLTDPPRKFLPYFRLADSAADRECTLEDLLSHRTGIMRNDSLWFSGALSSEELIRATGGARAVAPLRKEFNYQNIMYVAAGTAVAAAQHTSWSRLVASRIFRPLGMTRTNTTIRAAVTDTDHAVGYSWQSQGKQYEALRMRDVSRVAPAGAVNSCAGDMARWAQALLNRGAYSGGRLLSETSFDQLFRPRINISAADNYALGWIVGSWHGHRLVEHDGGIDGFHSRVSLLPDDNIALVVLTNVSSSALPDRARDLIYSAALNPKPVDAETPTVLAPVQKRDPAALMGTYEDPASHFQAEIALRGGQISLIVPRQPAYPLRERPDHRFGLEGLPDSFMIYGVDGPDGTVSQIDYSQPGVHLVLSRKASAAAFSEAETAHIRARMIDALGGEAAIRSRKSVSLVYDFDMENQNIQGTESTVSAAPNLLSSVARLTALGKPILTIRKFYDGKTGGIETSIGSKVYFDDIAKIRRLAIEPDFYAAVQPELLRSFKVLRADTLQGEAVFIVEKTPVDGPVVLETVSQKTFLPLVRQTSVVGVAGAEVPVTDTFTDYRPVGGVMTPYRFEETSSVTGHATFTLREALANKPVAARNFRASRRSLRS